MCASLRPFKLSQPTCSPVRCRFLARVRRVTDRELSSRRRRRRDRLSIASSSGWSGGCCRRFPRAAAQPVAYTPPSRSTPQLTTVQLMVSERLLRLQFVDGTLIACANYLGAHPAEPLCRPRQLRLLPVGRVTGMRLVLLDLRLLHLVPVGRPWSAPNRLVLLIALELAAAHAAAPFGDKGFGQRRGRFAGLIDVQLHHPERHRLGHGPPAESLGRTIHLVIEVQVLANLGA